MGKRTSWGGGKRRAVRETLRRLGMGARVEDVVAALAGYGIAVSPELVRSVRVEMLKGLDRVQLRREGIPRPGRRPSAHPFQKKLPRP